MLEYTILEDKFLDYADLGKRVKVAREKCGLTQQDLAEKAGYSTQHISNIENGMTKLSVDCLISIVDILDISADVLLKGNYEQHRNIHYEHITEILDSCSVIDLKKAEVMLETFVELLKGM